MILRFGALRAALVAGLALTIALACPAVAETSGSIVGAVVNVSTGAPIAAARVELDGVGQPQVVISRPDGSFSFDSLVAGTYTIKATATGYESFRTAPFALASGQDLTSTIYLQAVTTTSITSLAHITVRGKAELNTAPASTATITSKDFVANGQTQVEQALATTPGLTVEHFDNGAPGAVATISIRGAGGFGSSSDGGGNTGYEVLVLQDGEPMRNGQYGDFDVSTLTPDVYSRVEIVKGVGGTSLFGANTIGGTVNLVTRDPTKTESGEASIGFGGFQTNYVNLLQSDTFDRFGYVLDLHRYNTYGFYPPGFKVSYAPFGTPGDAAFPQQVMDLKSGLFKMKYAFTNTTSAAITVSDESDYRSQDGLIGDPLGYIDPSNGLPAFYGFPGDWVWNIQPKYSLDVTTALGGGTLDLRAYTQYLERVVDGLGEPSDLCCFLSRQVDHLGGDLVQWTKGFGNQTLTLSVGGNGDAFFFGEGFNQAETFAELNASGGQQTYRTYLIRDDDELSSKFDLTAAGYYSDYDTVAVKRFDPRIAMVNKPDASTVVKASVGTGFAAPRLSDLFTPADFNINDASPNAVCPTPSPCFGSAGNPSLKAETANGEDVSYQHLFGANGQIGVDFYRTNLTNHILDGLLPTAPGTVFQGTNQPMLFIQEPLNIAGAVYTGMELSATIPFDARTGIDTYYDTQAAYPTGVDLPTETVLQDVVNNQQFLGVPLHKAGWSLDYQNPTGGGLFFGGDWYGPNNAFNLPAFWTYRAGWNVPFSGDNVINMAWSNIFNKNANYYQSFRGGVAYPGFTGPYLTNGYNVAPHSLSITLTHRWGEFGG